MTPNDVTRTSRPSTTAARGGVFTFPLVVWRTPEVTAVRTGPPPSYDDKASRPGGGGYPPLGLHAGVAAAVGRAHVESRRGYLSGPSERSPRDHRARDRRRARARLGRGPARLPTAAPLIRKPAPPEAAPRRPGRRSTP